MAALLLYPLDLILSVLASPSGYTSSFFTPANAIIIPLIIAHIQPIINIPKKNYSNATT